MIAERPGNNVAPLDNDDPVGFEQLVEGKICHLVMRRQSVDVGVVQRHSTSGVGQTSLLLQPAAPAEPTDPLLEALGHDPVTMDALTARTGWSAQDLSAQLLTLELDGQVARLPGGLYQRLHRG